MDMDGEVIRLMKVLLICMASLMYCYYIASKLPKGKPRLLSLLPIFSLFAVLPLDLSYVVLTSGITIFVTWLTTFKLIQFSFDLGPLASDPPLSFPLFASIAFLPTRIKDIKTTPYVQNHKKDSNAPQELDQETPPKLPLNLPAKAFIFALLVICKNHVHLVHPILKLILNCGILYFYLDMIMSISNEFVRLSFGIEVRRSFDEPYLATSLQNFWGRRWNRLVSETLHNMIYKPIRYDVGSPRWMAVFVVFVVSGLMHELLFYYIIRVVPTWEVTWFFVIHGVFVALEIELKSALGKKWQFHWAVTGPLTMAFMAVTAHWLFFPQLLRMKYSPLWQA
ncbi:probable long-chain-alcohol O-fatty-acyltransferase 5 [Cucumis sativus]|uniref:Wax synthase domain-containing protein n=1 Tax=Cucumis sativus TaxID=3659 RepID=A0A0A0K522_CUCSA|nr:probable long-chain-alcohol O-fatty-acyltransferase 5 [Cucumis sativus]KGN44004.1 hypothetical protein Csa_016501 [Cucumis sativus]